MVYKVFGFQVVERGGGGGIRVIQVICCHLLDSAGDA